MDNKITTKSLIQKREMAARALEKKARAIIAFYNKIPPFAGRSRLGNLMADAVTESHNLANNLKLDSAYWPEGVK